METVKVLHVLGRLGSGGVEKLLVSVLENINRDEVAQDYLLFDPREGFYDDYVTGLGSKLYYVKRKQYPFKMLDRFEKQRGLYQFLRKNSYDIVQLHGTQPVTYIQAYLAKKAGARNVIIHAHNTKSLTGFKTKILPVFKLLFGKYPSHFIACSREAADYMWPKGLEAGKGSILINGLDFSKYEFSQKKRDRFRTENGLNGKYVVGHIGRFADQKNHRFLFKVFKGVQEKIPNSVLLLVGEGPMERKVREMAAASGVQDKIIFYGTTRDIPAALMGMDVMCFPSIYEGLGIAAVEAQAASLPVVVSEGVPESANISSYYHKLNLSDALSSWVDTVCSFLRVGGVQGTSASLWPIRNMTYVKRWQN